MTFHTPIQTNRYLGATSISFQNFNASLQVSKSLISKPNMPGNGVQNNHVSFRSENMESFFQKFDRTARSKLDILDFSLLCRTLFQNEYEQFYDIEEYQIKEVFEVFDKGKDGFIDHTEFAVCWERWIKTIFQPKSALLIVDVQNDFISGSLSISNCPAKHNGADIIKPINNLLNAAPRFDAVFYSLDWHPDDHISFIENVHRRPVHASSPIKAEDAHTFDTVIFDGSPPITQKLWPKHCVQNTWGAELHSDLKLVDGAVKIYKGTNPDVDSYSAFWDNNKIGETTLRQRLEEKNITDVYVCGLAYDVCVAATTIDALKLGYRTVLIEDCSRGVDLEEIKKTREVVEANHGVVVNSDKVLAMIEGEDRRPELGFKSALRLKGNLGK